MKHPLKFNQFGADHGRIVIYFHGAPGAAEECALFDSDAKAQGLTFICFDRFAADLSLSNEAYYRRLAEEILTKAAGKQVDIVGFSIGAFIALQTCRYLGDQVGSLHLVSAAAPLEAGDFLDSMAGKQVFRLAKNFSPLFVFLTYWQALLVLYLPHAFFYLLFADARGKDKELAADREFKYSMVKILNTCFMKRVHGYARDIIAYVNPWQATLSDVKVKTYIWHGAEDNWSPKPMADYLSSAIPGCVSTQIFEGLSHYSCLHRAKSEICNLLLDKAKVS